VAHGAKVLFNAEPPISQLGFLGAIGKTRWIIEPLQNWLHHDDVIFYTCLLPRPNQH